MADNDRTVKVKIIGDSANVEKELTKTERALKNFSKVGAVAGAAMGSAFALIGVKAVKAFAEADQAQRKTIALLQATGSAAGVTANQIFDTASKLQDATAYGDEALIGLQNTLLKFRNIKSDIFEPTTIAVTDMASALGIDLNAAAQMVGRALENPTQGLVALRRAGINFTESQQEQIKGFLAVNDVASAQKIILDSLEGRFKGSASEMAKGTAIFKQLGNQVGELFEQLGRAIFELINPALQTFTKWITKVKESNSVYNTVHNSIAGLQSIFISFVTNITSIGYKAIQYWYDLSAAIYDTAAALTFFNSAQDAQYKAAGDAARQKADYYKGMASNVSAEGDAKLVALGQSTDNPNADKLFGAQTGYENYSKKDKSGGGSGGLSSPLEQGLGYSIPAGSTDEDELALMMQANPSQLGTAEQREAYLAALDEQKQSELDVVQKYQQKILQSEVDFRSEMNSTIGGFLALNLADERISNKKKKDQADQTNNDLLVLTQAFGSKYKNITKAIQVSNAIMNTAEGITKTIARFGMPMAIPFVALTAAAGAAQVASIMGAANGTIVDGVDTGRDNRLMAVRSGEMIVPPQYVQGLLPHLADMVRQEDRGGMYDNSATGQQTIAIELRGDAGQFINATLIRDRAAGVI
jgi:hypothetical protein